MDVWKAVRYWAQITLGFFVFLLAAGRCYATCWLFLSLSYCFFCHIFDSLFALFLYEFTQFIFHLLLKTDPWFRRFNARKQTKAKQSVVTAQEWTHSDVATRARGMSATWSNDWKNTELLRVGKAQVNVMWKCKISQRKWLLNIYRRQSWPEDGL